MADYPNTRYLRDYLLGELEEKESRRIEERYFRDDEFFEELSAAEDELVRDYIRNELDPRARMRFVSHLAEDAALRRKLLEIEAINQELSESAPARSDEPQTKRRPGLLGVLWKPAFGWSLAAIAVGAAMFLSVAGIELRRRVGNLEAANRVLTDSERRLHTELQQSQQLAARASFTLSPGTTLGESRQQTLLVPLGARELKFTLTLRTPVPGGGSFRAVLQSPDGLQVWGGPASLEGDQVTATVPAAQVPDGEYLFFLQRVVASEVGAAAGAVSGPEELASYSFGLVHR